MIEIAFNNKAKILELEKIIKEKDLEKSKTNNFYNS